jgi:hypothetical protein
MSNLLKRNRSTWYFATYHNEYAGRAACAVEDSFMHPDRNWRMSQEHHKSPFQIAFKTNLGYLDNGGWLSQYPRDAFEFGQGYAFPLFV